MDDFTRRPPGINVTKLFYLGIIIFYTFHLWRISRLPAAIAIVLGVWGVSAIRHRTQTLDLLAAQQAEFDEALASHTPLPLFTTSFDKEE
jgi:hypothetical protein